MFVSEGSSLMVQRRGGVGNKFKLNKGEFIISTSGVYRSSCVGPCSDISWNENDSFVTKEGNTVKIYQDLKEIKSFRPGFVFELDASENRLPLSKPFAENASSAYCFAAWNAPYCSRSFAAAISWEFRLSR